MLLTCDENEENGCHCDGKIWHGSIRKHKWEKRFENYVYRDRSTSTPNLRNDQYSLLRKWDGKSWFYFPLII